MRIDNLTRDEILDIIENGKKRYIVVDIRSYNEYKTNRFEGAINIPFLNIETITNQVLFKDTYIFVYCASGVISEDAKKKLRKMGYKNAYNMGGIYNYTQYLYIE